MNMKSLIEKMDQLSQVDEAKPDFLDIDKDGDKKEPMKKAAKDKEEKVSERKDPDTFRKLKAEYEKLSGKKAPAGTSTQAMQILVDKAKKEKVDEAIAIQADGEEAMALLDMLKLAGRPAPEPTVTMGGCGMSEDDSDPTYANSPDEQIDDMDAATPSGNDMHREKDGWRAAASGDNPMIAAMEDKLLKMFENIVSKNDDEEEDEEEWYDSKGRPSKRGAYDAGGHYHSEREDVEVRFDNKKK